jgi:hypothetical protein
MRFSTSVNHASGSTLLSFAVYAARRTMPNGLAFPRSGRNPGLIGTA